jgi:hypothetical protein
VIKVYYEEPHPSHVAQQRLDIDPAGPDLIRVRRQYQSGRAAERWPDDLREYVRIGPPD